MRKVGNFLRMIAAALKATAMVPVIVGGEIVGWIWRSLRGQMPAPDVEETVEVPDAAAEVALQSVENGQRDREREEKQKAREEKTRPTPAEILKHIAQMRDERRPIDDSVYAHAPDRQKFRHYAEGLTDGDWHTILHMKTHALEKHLNVEDMPGLPSYVRYDWAAGGERALAASEAIRTRGWTPRQHFKDMLGTAIDLGHDDVDQRMLWKRAYAKARG